MSECQTKMMAAVATMARRREALVRHAIALGGCLAPALALAFSVPPAPSRFLYDGSGVLPARDRQRIETRLMQLNDMGQQIGVAILPSLEGESVEDASLRIARAWGPGRRGSDDGVLIAVFLAERQMRIEVGSGLEERIPDSSARQIIADQMRPAFRLNRFGDGLLNAINSVGALAAGRSPAMPVTRSVPIPGTHYRVSPQNPRISGGCGCLCWPLVALGIVSWLTRGSRRPRSYGFGSRSSWSSSSSSSFRSSGSRGGGGRFGGGSFRGGGASGRW